MFNIAYCCKRLEMKQVNYINTNRSTMYRFAISLDWWCRDGVCTKQFAIDSVLQVRSRPSISFVFVSAVGCKTTRAPRSSLSRASLRWQQFSRLMVLAVQKSTPRVNASPGPQSMFFSVSCPTTAEHKCRVLFRVSFGFFGLALQPLPAKLAGSV